MKPVRIACIGCGFIGRRHMQNAAQMEGVEIGALADLNLSSAEALRKEFGRGYATSDPKKVLADPDIDAVVIATHHDSHTTMALQAAAARKHILMEKPLALTVEECRSIAQSVHAAGIVFTINFKFRFAPAVMRAREMVPSPVVAHGQLAMERMPDDIWVRDPVRGGGLILATACHVLDMVCWLNQSEPVRVFAEAGRGGTDAVVATVRFANSSVASLLLADCGEDPHSGKWLHEIFDGERSAVLFDHFRQVTCSGPAAEHFAAPEDIRTDGTYGVMEDFVRAIRTGASPAITVDDGVRATLLALSVLESLCTGLPREIRLHGAA